MDHGSLIERPADLGLEWTCQRVKSSGRGKDVHELHATSKIVAAEW